MDPHERRDPRARVGPDLRPVRLRRPRAAEGAQARSPIPRANYPTLNRAVTGLYPPGSTFKPVTALAAIAGGPPRARPSRSSARASMTAGDDKQVFENWDPYKNEPMTLTTALANSCDTYFYEVALRAYERPDTPIQKWARRMGFGQPTGDRRRARGRGPRPDAGLAQAALRERLGPAVATGRLDPARDRPGRHARHAAPDDAALRAARERREARRAAHRPADRAARHRGRRRRRRPAASPARSRRTSASTRRRLDRAGGPLRRDARVLRHVDERLRPLPGPDRRQDRHGGEVRPAPRLHGPQGPVLVVRLGPVRRAGARRLRGDRERRPRRRGGGARRRSRCSRASSASSPARYESGAVESD